MKQVKIRIKPETKPSYMNVESSKQKRENKFKTSLKNNIPEVKSSEIQKVGDPVYTSYGTLCDGVCRGVNVVIKEFKELSVSDSEFFAQQAKILAHLRHPNIVLLLGVCTEPGYNAILTEPTGPTLSTLNSNNTVTLYQKLKYAKDVAQGLNWLHDSSPPIIHCNLKLENIVVDLSDKKIAKVSAFELSNVQKSEKLSLYPSSDNTPMVIDKYQSPEFLDKKEFDTKTDVYSFGLMLWEMATGEVCWKQYDNNEEWLNLLITQDIRPPLSNKIPDGLKDLIVQCWDKDPSKRPTFEEIIAKFDDVIIDSVLPLNAANFWKKNWRKKGSVKMSEFILTLLAYLKFPYVKNSYTVQCLQYMLCEGEEVKLDKFGNFINWFGPFNDNDNSILERLTKAMKKDWFHGDISRKDSTTAIEDVGSFLVRLNLGERESSNDFPFTISRMNKSGGLDHIRVGRNHQTKQLYVDIKSKDNVRRIAANTIDDLIESVQSSLNLKDPAPGRKYFKNVSSIGNYDQSSSSSDEKET